jgi:hypothetical protein
MRVMWLLLLLHLLLSTSAFAVTRDDGLLLTSMVASAASADTRIDVLTATDLKKAMDVEAGKMALCDTTSTSCFAELAAAMDASQVLHGSLGTLGSDVVLNLSLFDSSRATAVGRITLKERDVSALADRVEGGVSSLLARLPKSKDRVRVLVLDLDVVGASASSSSSGAASPGSVDAPVEAFAGPPVLSLVGVGVGVVGLGGLGFAGWQEWQLRQTLIDLKTPADATALVALQQQRDTQVQRAKIGWIVGGIVVAVGVVLAVVPVVVGE